MPIFLLLSNQNIQKTEDTLPPPGLEQPPSIDTYIHPAPKAMAKPDAFKPSDCLTTKQPPAIVGQHDNVLDTKELSL
eukprot:5929025-Amphidinium_carterae.1